MKRVFTICVEDGCKIGGLEAIDFFESLADRIRDDEKDTYQGAINRIRYEALKGIGCRIKTTKAVYKGHRDLESCGRCGYSGVRAHENYCPNCGTAYLRNSHTEEKVKEWSAKRRLAGPEDAQEKPREEEAKQMNVDEWFAEN